MSARIIDGKRIAQDVRHEVGCGVSDLAPSGVVPGLAAILVGEDPASEVYVGSKEKAAQKAGMNSWVHRLDASIEQDELIDRIRKLNEDPAVHGILLQLPLPYHLDPDEAVEAIDPAKDVDGLTSASAGKLALGTPTFVPCTALGIQVMLDRENYTISGKHVVIIGRSNLVGRPLSILLSLKTLPSGNATVTLCHTGTEDLKEHTSRADILVAAAGAPQSVTAQMVKPKAVVVDVGITRDNDGKLAGDVDFESVSQVASAITPVPGGVGPMTVAMLISNTLKAALEAANNPTS
ncbi:MAG: bifunctional 5,10-methylenetetrahydrofolate dehydrogenase/5,10-methenyltetrahydrofolate cyclohydrolase [Actinomycetota bacterium]